MKQILFGHATDEPAAGDRHHPGQHGRVWEAGTNSSRFYFGQTGTVSFPRMLLGTAPGTSNGFTFEIRKNDSASGAIELDFGATDTDVSDDASTITVAAGDYLIVRCTVVTGTPAFSDASFAWMFEGDTAGLAIASSGSGSECSSLSTGYMSILSPFWGVTEQTTEQRGAGLVPLDGTINSLKIYSIGAPTSSQDFELQLNGVGVAASQFSIISPATTGEVTGLSIAVAKGDLLSLEWINNQASNRFITGLQVTYTPDIDGESVIGGITYSDLDNTATEYNALRGGTASAAGGGSDSVWTATEANREGLVNGSASAPDWVLRNMWAWNSVAPGAGNSYTFTARNNGGDGNSTLVISGASETEDTDAVNTDTYSAGATGSIKVVPASTPTVAYSKWSAIQFIAPPGGDATPPGTYTVEVDKDANGSFEEDITSVTLSTPGVDIVIGSDADQRLIPPRVSQATYRYKFPVISGIDRGDAVRIQGTFNSVTYGMFKGNIEDLSIDPNIDQQNVAIKALGFLAPAANLKGFSTQLYEDISIDTAIGHVLTLLGLTGAERVLDAATRGNLEHWWLDSEDNVWNMLQRLVRTEGPNARFYEDGDGVVQFEAEDFRTTATRSTVLQETFSGATTEPIYSRMMPIEDTSKRVINNVQLAQSIRAADNNDIEYAGTVRLDLNGSNTSATIDKPTGLVDGDIMFANIGIIDNTGANPSGLTAPSGWTLVESGGSANSGDFLSYVYWKRADDTDADVTTYQWTWTNSCSGALNIDVYRSSVGIGDPIEASQVDSNLDNDFTPTSTSITTLGANRRIITWLGANSTSASWTPPTGFVLRGEATGTGISTIQSKTADMTASAAGAVGALTWDAGSGSGIDSVITTVALVPQQSTVWNAGGDLTFGNDEVFKIVARASNPFTNAIVPVVSTDYTIAAGALSGVLTLDRTSGQTVTINGTAGAAGITFQGPTDNTDQGMTLRADELPITVRNEVTSETGDADRVLPAYTVWPHISRANMQELADDIISYASTSKQVVKITIYGDRDATALTASLERLPSDRVRVIATRTAVNITGFVEEIRWHLGPGAGAPYLRTQLTIREA